MVLTVLEDEARILESISNITKAKFKSGNLLLTLDLLHLKQQIISQSFVDDIQPKIKTITKIELGIGFPKHKAIPGSRGHICIPRSCLPIFQLDVLLSVEGKQSDLGILWDRHFKASPGIELHFYIWELIVTINRSKKNGQEEYGA